MKKVKIFELIIKYYFINKNKKNILFESSTYNILETME
jgi:hypothetical protein